MTLPSPARYAIQTLWRQLVKLDKSGDGPWPLSVYDQDTDQWQPVAGVRGSSPLVLVPNAYNFVSASAADLGQPVDFVVTASGDVISVGGQ